MFKFQVVCFVPIVLRSQHKLFSPLPFIKLFNDCYSVFMLKSFIALVFGGFFRNLLLNFPSGSGIPEVRTILVGFEMPHYLSVTHLFTKFLGLICTLAAGSTVFLGKVVRGISAYVNTECSFSLHLHVLCSLTMFVSYYQGPFVHLSTMVGAYLSNLCTLIQTNKKVKPQ